MNRRVQIITLTVAGCLFIACSTSSVNNLSAVEQRRRVWATATDHAPIYREDGEGPFDPPWPAAAVALESSPGSHWEGTLFLLAGPNLNAGNAFSYIPTLTRFATPCRLPEIHGRWLKMVPNEAEFFVLTYHPGGAGGPRLLIIKRYWRYDGDAQVHWFHPVLDRVTCLIPYIVDIDNDKSQEILVAAEDSGDPANGDPMIYEAFGVVDGSFRFLKRLDAADVDRFQDRQALWQPE